MYFFTSDTHFGGSDILLRENRPYQTAEDFARETLKKFNLQVKEEDIMYHLGDFINYNEDDKTSWKEAVQYVNKINCKVVLLIGNNEERIIKEQFDSNFDAFREYMLDIGFYDVKKDDILQMGNRTIYLQHYPSKHKEGLDNLFGHTHRATGLWKPYGLNVGCDLNHFYLFSEDEILKLLDEKKIWWDKDPDILSI